MSRRKRTENDGKDIDKLSPKGAQKEIQSLREEIEHHDRLYYVENKPEISDARYDRLFSRLVRLEQAFPEFHSDTSPTQRVGAEPLESLDKVEHARPMLSLDAYLEESPVRDFIKSIRRKYPGRNPDFMLEPKFDGVSIEVVYEKGVFHHGATRGDGKTGEDISHNLKTIHAVPMKLTGNGQLPKSLAVRGEVFMPKRSFQEMNRCRVEGGREPLANPRNATAGIVRQLDPSDVAGKNLGVVFYEILSIEGLQIESHWSAMHVLRAWGLRTDRHNARSADFEDIRAYHKKLRDERESLEYEIDGVVIKVDDYSLRSDLGTRRRSPRWALAWKFKPKEEITMLRDIVVQVGKSGMMTPVALLDPVNVGGVTVSRATLHNEHEALRKDVRPGDTVQVIRAGDVIPEVLKRIPRQGRKRSPRFSMPGTCPSCGSRVEKEGAYRFCPAGLSCPAQLAERITHYASPAAADIRGLGREVASRLVDSKLVKDMADLHHLTEDDLAGLEGFAEKSASKLHRAIRDSRNISLERFLYALGIRHVGEHASRILSETFDSLDAIRNADLERLADVPGIGTETARSVRTFFSAGKNREIIERLLQSGLHVRRKSSPNSEEPLAGLTVVFTGSMRGHTRKQAKDLVESLGGHASSSVSAKTDVLVAGKDPGRKYDDAKRHEVKIIGEEEFSRWMKDMAREDS